MKAVILAGGLGTRISEESTVRPKPMVEIGGRPVLWHIMKIYSAHGVNDFIILCGYKQHMIKEYFANYFLHMSDVTFDMRTQNATYLCNQAEPWRVTLVDTGEDTLTGGRLKRVRHYLGDEPFCFTYGDGVGDVDIAKTIEFHRGHGKLATMTVMQPPGRFGAVNIEDGGAVTAFHEKPDGDGGWINGGFFVLEPSVIDYIDGDQTTWEAEPLKGLAHDGQLAAYRHPGFWQPMDTLRDKHYLEDLWKAGKAPWKTW
ncbi:glucose-1-phosphate cytidylyltransferase [Deinococcus aestuarii]|uniref:glucose-1-phosphate cytidylyltransferase n=1 Tax=Deinococcus aestuarii TaxID=2774531 RepID=UPI001C0E1ADB